jgi:hypothetical protein
MPQSAQNAPKDAQRPKWHNVAQSIQSGPKHPKCHKEPQSAPKGKEMPQNRLKVPKPKILKIWSEINRNKFYKKATFRRTKNL